MLTKDLLRVTRRGGDYRPTFAGREARPLAARVLGTYQGHVGERRGRLDEALDSLEREAADFKLVRGFATLLERDATFATEAAIPPERARRAAFEAAEAVGAVGDGARATALARAADRLGVDAAAVDAALYADRPERQVLTAFDARWGPDELVTQYDLSLAQTALFDATEVRVRSSDPKALVSAVKRLRLLYEIERTDDGREVVVTGPDAVFSNSRRYGTRFARLLRTVATAAEWELTATIDDRGTERTMRLSDADPIAVPDADPVADVTFDSAVEADFAARFEALDLDWALTREPEPLATGTRVMIPDFAFDYAPGGDPAAGPDTRVFFEIMGFWTPEYVAKKLSQLDTLEDVDMLVAVDESLGVGEDIEARDHRAIPYSGTVRVKDVRDALRRYEADLEADAAAALPDELTPADDAVPLDELAARHGVAVAAVEDKAFPEHRLVGRTLVRPAVLTELRGELSPGQSLAEAEAAIETYDVADTSAVLQALGYRVEWEGLSGGTLARRADGAGE